MVSIFLILPESECQNQWMLSNHEFQDEGKVVDFVRELRQKIEAIKLENYNGLYDSINVSNFLKDFEILGGYYPNPTFRLLRSILFTWKDWRVSTRKKTLNEYRIFGQPIENHTFCECAEMAMTTQGAKQLLLNHYGHRLPNELKVHVDHREISLISLSTVMEIVTWFAFERIPSRSFHVIEKHGENRSNVILRNGEKISPLRSGRHEAQILLNFAIGDDHRELYNIDRNHNEYIVFKFEGQTPQNVYHGYHVALNSNEIPEHMKAKLNR